MLIQKIPLKDKTTTHWTCTAFQSAAICIPLGIAEITLSPTSIHQIELLLLLHNSLIKSQCTRRNIWICTFWKWRHIEFKNSKDKCCNTNMCRGGNTGWRKKKRKWMVTLYPGMGASSKKQKNPEDLIALLFDGDCCRKMDIGRDQAAPS